MKPEEDGLILEVKRELGAVESSLLPIEALFHRAQEQHDSKKIQRFSEEREGLLKARDKLQQEIKELVEFDALHEDQRNAISSAWHELKDALSHFKKKHG